MYENETYENIMARMLSRFPDTYDKRQGSTLWDLLSPKAIELSQAYMQMDNVLNLGFAETATGDLLERRVAEQGLTRKESIKSTGSVIFTGPIDTVIPVGTRISTVPDTTDTLPVYFVTTEEKTIASGFVDVAVIAEEGGYDGNVFIGAISQILGDLSGTITVSNLEAFTGGIDEETDEELYTRYKEKVSRPSTSGNKYHYEQWAQEVQGISDARCYPLWNGPGTVKVVVINSEKRSPSQTVLNEAIDYIETIRPVGVSVTVNGVTEISIDVSANLTLRSGAVIDQVRDSIIEHITNYFKSIAFVEDTVRFTAIGNAILDADGVIDYTDLRINGLSANIILGADDVPVIGAVTVSSLN